MNFGDELFVAASLMASGRYWPDYQAYVNSPPLNGLPVDGKYRCPAPLKKFFHRNDPAGQAGRLLTLLRTLQGSDLLVFAGGSTLAHFSQNHTVSLIEWMGRFRSYCTAGVGVSVGPFKNDSEERACKKFLERFSFLALRDRQSYLIASSMDLPFQPIPAKDLAGVLPFFLKPLQLNCRTRLGVSLCNYEKYKAGCSTREETRNTAIAEGIATFASSNGVPVTVFILNNHPVYGDWEISMHLAMMLREKGVEVEVETLDSGPLHLWEKIGSCRAVFSVRLHGAISAYLQNVPFSLVEYHRKCSDFLEDVGQRPSNRLPSDGFGATAVYQVLEQIYFQQSLPVMPICDYISCALTNFTEAPWASKPCAHSAETNSAGSTQPQY